MKITTRIRSALIPALLALTTGVMPLGAQVTPPTPPRPPSPIFTPPGPPRAPRAPRAWSGDDGVARIDTVVPFSANGTVELSLIAGSIKVSTWDRNQVKVVATTSGEPSLQFDANSSHLSLEQNGRRNRHDTGPAMYDVTVPVGVRATLGAVSGSVEASGIRGQVDVNVVSGTVSLRDLGSSVSIEGVSGDITATRIANDVRVENVSGRVSLSSVGGTVNAETVSGGVSLRGVGGDRVHVTTVSGNIDFAGPGTRSARYDFETHSGRTDIRLGSNANATVSVETFNGAISVDYPGAVRRKNADPDDDRTNYDYVIGRGEGRIQAQTFSGTVHISQGNP